MPGCWYTRTGLSCGQAAMSQENTSRENGTDCRIDDLCKRDVRALTEYMSVLPDTGPATGAHGLYRVVTESGSAYTVDTVTGACECPDARHRDVRCKHLRRVAFATGTRKIPGSVNAGAVDPDLGAHIDSTPTVARTHAVAADGGAVEAQESASEDVRPDDCSCSPTMEDLCCFECWIAGFSVPSRH